MPIPGIIASSVVPAAGAFESIASATGTGSAASITFSSIPAGYQHLQIRGIMQNTGTTTSARSIQLQLNSDTTGGNYASHLLLGDGASAAATNDTTSGYVLGGTLVVANNFSTGDYVGNIIVDIHDYANTSKNTTVRIFTGFDRNGAGRVFLSSGLWINTNAVTSVTLLLPSENFTTKTSFALYGIKAAA